MSNLRGRVDRLADRLRPPPPLRVVFLDPGRLLADDPEYRRRQAATDALWGRWKATRADGDRLTYLAAAAADGTWERDTLWRRTPPAPGQVVVEYADRGIDGPDPLPDEVNPC